MSSLNVTLSLFQCFLHLVIKCYRFAQEYCLKFVYIRIYLLIRTLTNLIVCWWEFNNAGWCHTFTFCRFQFFSEKKPLSDVPLMDIMILEGWHDGIDMMTGWHDGMMAWAWWHYQDIVQRFIHYHGVMDNSCGSPSALFNVDSCVETKVETTAEISVPKINCALFSRKYVIVWRDIDM